MSAWIWITLFLALVLSVGLVTDRRRRHSTGGELRDEGPTQARRSAEGGEAGHVPPGY